MIVLKPEDCAINLPYASRAFGPLLYSVPRPASRPPLLQRAAAEWRPKQGPRRVRNRDQEESRTGTKKSPEQGPRRVRNREDLGSREDRCYGGPTLSTHGGCPRGVSAMPMSLRNRNTHPRRAQRRLQQLALILSLLWILKTQVKAEEYGQGIIGPIRLCFGRQSPPFNMSP
ncbi:uncharacterized protein AAES06_013659 isoform 2-T2 [Glossophaga mutica]